MLYMEIKEYYHKQINDFPAIFAFSKAQFDEKYNTPEFKGHKLLKNGFGSYIRKKDKWKWLNLWDRRAQDISLLKENESAFLEAIVYELGNHEYGYTYDISPIKRIFDLNESHNDLIERAIAQYFKEVKILKATYV